ncbi:MAG: hypothetical protein K2Y02_00010 [Burkholderiaceae bacterium]|jgi:hypothetical protein|nr:hypothetical protein [Burkholderiaceae bacterium]
MPASLRTLIERADRFVRSMEDARREPDRWEGLCTLQALADMAAGRTDQAEARLALAKTPPIVRISPDPPHVRVDCPEPTAADLRQELDRIKALAVTS